ncbi:UNVERIFIED_CONTAM: hypothetical protein PYX00_002211 [Menopon gallinae]|uniref:Uncharacterized protein n=1 Tax=Menopon gallinae TaxID=328185 RepID=A0AAW2IG29_9NEOP
MKYSFIILFLATALCRGSNRNGVKVCTICRCHQSVVDCSRLDLDSSFEASAWDDIASPNSTWREIDLSNNRIGSVTVFPKLPITKLSLRNNIIVQIADLAFKNLTHLIDLDLGDNQLTSAKLNEDIFQGPFSYSSYELLPIKNLDLSGNEIHTLNYRVFIHVPNIKRLNLRKNPLKTLTTQTVLAISELRDLEELDLSYTQLHDLPMGFLHSLNKLTVLNLKGNNLKELPSDVLFESHNLAVLNLDYNPIKAITTEKPFPDMPTLKVLQMSHMSELKRIENYSMHGLKGLDTLLCRDNEKLEFISEFAFASHENDTSRPNITRLDLNDNALRYLNRTFVNIEHLKVANLLGNIWSCDCENQWMLTELIPHLLKMNSRFINGLTCSEPTAMQGKHMLDLHKHNYEMRCLDYYGNDPENDSVILITVFSLIIAVMAIALVVVWKIRVGSCRRDRHDHYSRAFYKPTQTEERY